MTNRVDFYQTDRQELAVPAGAAVVFIEGRVCPYLEVIEIVRQGKPDYGSARLRYNLAADSGPESVSIEKVEREIGTGRPVSIKWIYDNLYPVGGADEIVIFAGLTERFNKTIDDLEIIVRDYSSTLERITVIGRQTLDIDGRVVFLEGQPTTFNEGGLPNATSESVEYKGNNVLLFAAGTKDVKLWDCADAIRYLLCEYLPAGMLMLPEEDRLRAIAGGEKPRDLNVTGLSLLEAIERVCEQAGVEFKFVPRISETGPAQAIVFYRKGCGRSVELNLQQQGERLDVSKTNIFKVKAEGNFWPVTHRYVGLGDYKVYEVTFYLVRAWKPYLESVDYDRYSPLTNPNFIEVKDVYRSFCLNEAGDFSVPPYNRGPAYDFSPVFGTDKYVHRRRRFWPAVSCDAQGKSLGYFLEISYDGGNHWWQYMHAFDILLDECGIWLSSNRLDINTWVAGIKNVLHFRLTASVISDERLTCCVADGPVGSTVPVVEKIISAANRFKYRKVTGKSIFANRNDGTVGKPDESDDSAALNQYVRRIALANQSAIETFEVQTPFLAVGFEVGDIVKTGPDSRDVFSTVSDNKSTSVIEQVKMNFEKQTTEVKVVRRRIL